MISVDLWAGQMGPGGAKQSPALDFRTIWQTLRPSARLIAAIQVTTASTESRDVAGNYPLKSGLDSSSERMYGVQ